MKYIPRLASVIGAIALVGAMSFANPSPSSAAVSPTTTNPPDVTCDPTVAGGTVGLGCTQQGSGNGTYIPSDPAWVTIARFPNLPCTDSNGNISYMGTIVHMPGATDKHDACLINHFGNATDVVGIAKKAIFAPELKTNFKAEFLTGAEITFTTPGIKNYIVNVPNFPGRYLTVNAVDVTWDFGDGTTSHDLSPKHTYENIAVDSTKSNQHTVHVTITGTWHVILVNTVQNETEDLGTFSGTDFLDRSIVQVWSKQTEPNS